MDIVKRYPFTIQSKTGSLNFAIANFFPHGPASGHSPDVSVVVGILRFFQFADHVVQPGFYFGISCRCIHVCKCRQVMSSYMPVEAGIFPIWIIFSFRCESGFTQIRSQQTIGTEFEQVLHIHFFGMPERTLGKTNILGTEVRNFLIRLCKNS